ncbi:MbeD family mobilization/exclusion protein, partial [Escherichia coli]|uniref:MbeD family mobilization/exclusion protein n=1 Tax=Escherichia coli TaxID=562 RepID=UPI001BFD919D
DYSKRLDEWESAFAEWRTMSGLMQRENAALSERVTGLSRQVQHQKALELERSQRQRTYNSPSL